MNGSLLNQMRTDVQNIVNSGGFQTSIKITDLAGATQTIEGLASLHHTSFNSETGEIINARNAHVTFALKDVVLNYYTDMKHTNTINMTNWIVEFEDSNGKQWKFKALDIRPDYTFNVVTVYLGDYE